MIAAGLLLRSFWDLFEVQPGFNPSRVMAIDSSLVFRLRRCIGSGQIIRRRFYLDQGGTTPLARAYAIDCPRCSC